MRRNIGVLLAAAMAACAGIERNINIVTPSHESKVLEPLTLPSRTVQIGGDGWHPITRGPGWTVAQVKRMARKQRNQKKHRAACRKNGGTK